MWLSTVSQVATDSGRAGSDVWRPRMGTTRASDLWISASVGRFVGGLVS
jgi:hypothetical protein